MEQIIKIGLHGTSGRMGSRIKELILKDKAFSLVAEYNTTSKFSLQDFCKDADLIIDFSSAEALAKLIPIASKMNKRLLTGTTGLLKEHFDLLESAAKNIPIFYSANTSIAVAVLTKLLGDATMYLKDFNVEIKETHHIHKKDSPSGTAIELASAINKVKSFENSSEPVKITSFRAQEAIGEHEVVFSNEFESLSFKHTAITRDVFAIGAVNVAKWLVTKPQGLYSMKDFLGEK